MCEIWRHSALLLMKPSPGRYIIKFNLNNNISSFISSDYKSKFQELTEMFSEDQNQKIFRRILLKVSEANIKMFFFMKK